MATRVLNTPLERFDKRCHSIRSLFVPLHRNVVFHFRLLLGTGCICRRRPRPFHRQRLVGRKSLYRPYALSNHLEHCVELSCNNIFVYLGRRTPEHPMPEEASGKRLDGKMYKESITVVC